MLRRNFLKALAAVVTLPFAALKAKGAVQQPRFLSAGHCLVFLPHMEIPRIVCGPDAFLKTEVMPSGVTVVCAILANSTIGIDLAKGKDVHVTAYRCLGDNEPVWKVMRA